MLPMPRPCAGRKTRGRKACDRAASGSLPERKFEKAMNSRLMLAAAALTAIAGVVLLFVLDSKVFGLLLIVAAQPYVVTMMNSRKSSGSGTSRKKSVEENVADLNDHFRRARYQDKEEK